MKNLRFIFGFLALTVVPCVPSWAAIYGELLTEGGLININGAFFLQGRSDSGTGNFPSFVQVGGGSSVAVSQPETYNTNFNFNGPASNLNLFNGSADTHNFPISVGDLTTTTNGQFYVFSLDINENNSAAGDKYLSLDEIRIWVGGVNGENAAALSLTTIPTGSSAGDFGSLAYRMDSIGEDNTVLLDFDLATGSGSSDMFLFVPVSFIGTDDSQTVIFFSRFGNFGLSEGGTDHLGNPIPTGDYRNSDGFEEWAFAGFDLPGEIEEPVPEPMSLAIWSLGLAGVGLVAHRRRKLLAA
jgi:hypothetical protein